MNQAIIIRNEEGNNTGIENWETDGFTITMWVKFLDKVNGGTLFNYGNPLRENNPMGFMLETFVIHKDDVMSTTPWGAPEGSTWGDVFEPGGLHDQADQPSMAGYEWFVNSDTERFIRLVVRQSELHNYSSGTAGVLLDSSTGTFWIGKRGIGFAGDSHPSNFTGIPTLGGSNDDTGTEIANEAALFTHTRVPVDLNEWYFVVATYDGSFTQSHVTGINKNITDFWKGNCTGVAGGTAVAAASSCASSMTHHSGQGSQCKVEIISKSELLRARGFKI